MSYSIQNISLALPPHTERGEGEGGGGESNGIQVVPKCVNPTNENFHESLIFMNMKENKMLICSKILILQTNNAASYIFQIHESRLN